MSGQIVAGLLDTLERQGVVFGVVAGNLTLDAPAGVLTAEVRALVSAHKAALTGLVRAVHERGEYGNTEEVPASAEDLRGALLALNAAPHRRLGQAAWLAASGLTPTRFARARRALVAAGKVRNLGPIGPVEGSNGD